jgi:hypothetical protein
MKNGYSSRQLRRKFGVDVKGLMGMLDNLQVEISSEMLKIPQNQTVTLSKETLEAQMTNCMKELKKHFHNTPSLAPAPAVKVEPQVKIKARDERL